MRKQLSVLAMLLILTACSTAPGLDAATTAKTEINFIDLQSFDRDLSGSLSATLPKVNVIFYDDIVPSALPERLRSWMAAVEAGGGKVEVVPSKSAPKTRAFPLLFSVLSSLWSASKMFEDASTKSQFRAAQSYDAVISLRNDDRGQTYINQVTFIQRNKKINPSRIE